MVEEMPSGVSYNHKTNLAYLINEVYRPRIEEVVNFRLLLSYMPFMGKILPDVYDKEKNGNKKEAAAIFFNYLKEVEEEGKYQSFAHSLKQAGYPVLVLALENNEVILNNEEEHKQLINIFFREIVDVIDPEQMSQELQMSEVITSEEGDKIRKTARQSTSDASFELLLKIPHRVMDWYKIFLELLLRYGHKNLVNKIDPKFYANKFGSYENEQNSLGPAADPSLLTVEGGRSSDQISGAQSRTSAVSRIDRGSEPNIPPTRTIPDSRSVAPPMSRERTEAPVSDFKKEVLSELAALKSLFRGQADYLKNLLEKTELAVRRVERLENTLESAIASNSVRN